MAGHFQEPGSFPSRSASASELRRHWRILLACMVGCALGVATLPSYLLGPLAPLLTRSLHWSTTDILQSTSFLAAGVAMGAMIAGRLCDRHDPRKLAALSIICLAALFVVAIFASAWSVWAFRAICLLMGLTAGGTSGVIYTRIISAHFVRARGLALGITISGAGITAFAAPLVVHAIGSTYGWQAVFLAVTAVLLLFALPVVWLGTGDGDRPGASQAANPASGGGLTLAQAVRGVRFYLLLVPLVALGLIMGSVLVVTVPALVSRGISPARAAEIASLFGISQVVARLGCGWVLDRVRPSIVAMAVFSLGAIGAYSFNGGGTAGAMLAVIFIGIVNGAEIDLVSFMTARFYGVAHYGSIFGAFFGSYMVICIIGPLFGAQLIALGGYAMLFNCVAMLFLVAAGAMAMLLFVEGEAHPSAVARH